MIQNNLYLIPSRLKAVFWILCWAFALSFGMSLAKILPKDLPNAVVVASRCWFGFLMLMPAILATGVTQVIRSPQISLNLLRGLITCAAMGCTYYAYRHLPLAYASSIGQSGPLFTTVLATLLLREIVSWRHWILILLGYAGVIVMVQPTWQGVDFATFIALLANLLAGLSIVTARKLSANHSPLTLVFYTTSVAMMVMTVFGIAQWQWPSYTNLGILAVIGGLGVASQLCYVKALKYAPASFVAPFEYTRLCVAVPMGYILFGEVPEITTVIGSFMIVLAALALMKLEARAQHELQSARQ
jgi:drug/metabolite transporter (DMT)-like permease